MLHFDKELFSKSCFAKSLIVAKYLYVYLNTIEKNRNKVCLLFVT